MTTSRIREGAALAAVAVAALLLSACASPSAPPIADPTRADGGSRVSVTHDGGVLVLDGASLDVIADLPIAGFTRLNAAGDGVNVLVTTAEGFRVLDTGADGKDPDLTSLVFEADTAGHVVRHAGKTVLFADGTGDTTIFDADSLRTADGVLPKTEVVPAPAPHHGVAIELADGTLLTTVGDSTARTGIRVLDADRREVAVSSECPSVHGEGAAADEVVVFGCRDGVLVYDHGQLTKIAAPDAVGRTGNIYAGEGSPIAIGDYNSDPDAEGYLLTQLLIVDTVAKTSTVVDLPEGVSYTWRGLARGPEDEVLLLSSDGSLYVLDPATGDVIGSHPVIAPWEGPLEWQDPHPALAVVGWTAYVTEPAAGRVHALDLTSGAIRSSQKLPGTPNELVVVPGSDPRPGWEDGGSWTSTS